MVYWSSSLLAGTMDCSRILMMLLLAIIFHLALSDVIPDHKFLNTKFINDQPRSPRSLSKAIFEKFFVFSSDDPKEENPFLYQPVQMKLVHKSTIVSSDSDRETINQNSNFNHSPIVQRQGRLSNQHPKPTTSRLSNQHQKIGNPSYSPPPSQTFPRNPPKSQPFGFSKFSNQPQQNQISKPPSKSYSPSPFISRFSQLLSPRQQDFPVPEKEDRPVEVRSYIAVPGKRVEQVSATSPLHLIGRRVSTNHGSGYSLDSAGSQSVMTIVPAVVRKLSDAFGSKDRGSQDANSVFSLIRRMGQPGELQKGNNHVRYVRQPVKPKAIFIFTKNPRSFNTNVNAPTQNKEGLSTSKALFNHLPNLTPRIDPPQILQPPYKSYQGEQKHRFGHQVFEPPQSQPAANFHPGGNSGPLGVQKTRGTSERQSHLSSRSNTHQGSSQRVNLDPTRSNFASNEFLIL